MTGYFSIKYFFVSVLIALSFFVFGAYVHAATGTIVSGYQQSTLLDQDLNGDTFDDVINWIPRCGAVAPDNDCPYPVTVTDSGISGDIWGESIGWIRLACVNNCADNDDYGVINTAGVLSGYAWGENAGWISFNCENAVPDNCVSNGNFKVTIASNGEFSGHAWSQNYGWISFNCTTGIDTAADSDSYIDTCVKTNWTPTTTSDSGPPPLVDMCPNVGGFQTSLPAGYTYENGICVGPPPAPAAPVCSDSIDNDNDGMTDFPTDPGCSSVNDTSELNFIENVTCVILNNCPDEEVFPPDDITLPLPDDTTITPPPGSGGEEPPPNPRGDGGVNIPPIPGTSGGTSFFEDIFKGPHGETPTFIRTLESIRDTFILKNDNSVKTGSLVGILAMAFALPFTFWPALLAVFGYRRRHAWGVVYDSGTKHPLDPARVVLFDLSGNILETSLTDIDGRFGFNPKPGTYRLVAYKEGYAFPSQHLSGKESDEVYSNLYFGGDIVITSSNQTVVQNIPLDPIGVPGGVVSIKEASLETLYVSHRQKFAHLALIIFILGFTFSLGALFNSPTGFNFVIVIVYIIFLVFREAILHLAPGGGVIDRSTGKLISHAILHIVPKGQMGKGIKKVTNAHGRYYAHVPNGEYSVSIDRKNPDGTYTRISVGDIVVTHEMLSKTFEI